MEMQKKWHVNNSIKECLKRDKKENKKVWRGVITEIRYVDNKIMVELNKGLCKNSLHLMREVEISAAK